MMSLEVVLSASLLRIGLVSFERCLSTAMLLRYLYVAKRHMFVNADEKLMHVIRTFRSQSPSNFGTRMIEH